uniref:Uncharacterized protein n=1 Tax=Anguilla anguilla TaxID=7936 RepID=A0A0E9U1R9_ANGAN
MLVVPERAGTPPSIAESIRLCTACFSRPKGFFKIRSANLEPSLPV